MITSSDLFIATDVRTQALVACDKPWEILVRIAEFLQDVVGSRREISGCVMTGASVYDGPVLIEEGAVIEPGACVMGRAYIGRDVTVRSGAYVRDNTVLLEGSLLGHASESKNSLFLQGAKAPHFAYVGDSVLGARVNLGAGTKLSNMTITHANATVKVRDESGAVFDTGLRKLGAILGDDVSTGCNVVLNPGTILGQRTVVYPGAVLGPGVILSDVFVKSRQVQKLDPRR